MFNNSDIKEPKSGLGFWLKIAAAVVLILLAYNFFRVNRTDTIATSPTPVPVQYSDGEIASGQISIEAGGFMPYRVNFNHRATINGDFRVVGKDPWITCLILNEANFEKWRNGNDFASVNSTGRVPIGRVSREVEPGIYFLVFDNRASQDKNAVVDVSFSTE
jgi:hypothetical protein